MKKMINKLSMVLVLIVIFALCVGENAIAATSTKPNYNINIASVYAAEGNIHEGMVKFKELLEERTNKRMQVAIHAAGAMGGEREVVEGLSSGAIEMGAHGGMDLTLYFPEYTVFEDIMFVFRDQEHNDKFWDTIGQEIIDDVASRKGILTVGLVPRGSRYITANKPINTPEDLKGLKFRLPSYPLRIKYFESIGAVATVVDFPELYMALKTGVIDAQENPPETIYNYKYYEAQKYLIATEHIITPNRYAVSTKWLDRLDQEDQDLILKTWEEATAYARSMTPDPDAYYVKKLVEEEDMILIEPNKEPFVEAAFALYEEVKDEYDWEPGLLERIMAIE